MGHHNHHKAHSDLQARLDRLPSSFPDTPEGLAVLRLLFTEEEAQLVAQMPLRPFRPERLAQRLGRDAAELRALLDAMADRGLIFDLHDARRDRSYYCVAPPVIGFFELSLMRVRRDIDQGAVARAMEAYSETPGSFAETLFAGPTQVGRALVHEEALDETEASELLTYERATDVVGSATARSVSLCYCRHAAEHLGKRCAAPMDNCMTLGPAATALVRHGLARPIERPEALEILQASREQQLVFIADNVQNRVSYICSCCKCCCGQLSAITRLGIAGAIKTSSFVAQIDRDRCTGCGRCARACPVQAVSIRVLPPHVERKKRMYSTVDEELCLGCGVCHSACRTGALRLARRDQKVLTPEGTLERVLMMALERNRLQHLIFDELEGLHALVLNRLAGAILRLPHVKKALLAERLKSRFVGFLARSAGHSNKNL